MACEMTTGHFNKLQENIGVPPGLRLGVTLVCTAIMGEVLEEIIQKIAGKTRDAAMPLCHKLLTTMCLIGLMSHASFTSTAMPASTPNTHYAREMPKSPRDLHSPNKKYKIILPDNLPG